jgi:hypothetical protein
MLSDLLTPFDSHVMSVIIRCTAVCCLFYAGRISAYNHDRERLMRTLIYGRGATAIVYFKIRYLDV